MQIKALNDRNKLSNDFNEANDAFIDEVLAALQLEKILPDLARAYLAHPVAMMHADGAQAVANYLDRMLSQRPNIDWTPGGGLNAERNSSKAKVTRSSCVGCANDSNDLDSLRPADR